MNDIIEILKGFGPAGGILVILAITARQMAKWAMPWAEKIVQAHISRQQTMEECQKKLTESTIQIQAENKETLTRIEGKLPLLCLQQSKPTQQ